MVAFQTSKVRCLDLVRGKLPIAQPLQRNSWFKHQIQKPTAPVVNLALPLPPVQLNQVSVWKGCTYSPEQNCTTIPLLPKSSPTTTLWSPHLQAGPRPWESYHSLPMRVNTWAGHQPWAPLHNLGQQPFFSTRGLGPHSRNLDFSGCGHR